MQTLTLEIICTGVILKKSMLKILSLSTHRHDNIVNSLLTKNFGNTFLKTCVGNQIIIFQSYFQYMDGKWLTKNSRLIEKKIYQSAIWGFSKWKKIKFFTECILNGSSFPEKCFWKRT